MATLNVASKANQAVILPALLIASYAKESDPNASINVNFEEVEILKSGDEAVVEFIVGSGTSTYGTEDIISNLIDTYPFLQGKHEKLVSVDGS